MVFVKTLDKYFPDVRLLENTREFQYYLLKTAHKKKKKITIILCYATNYPLATVVDIF